MKNLDITPCYQSIVSLCEKNGTRIVFERDLPYDHLGGFDIHNNEIIIFPIMQELEKEKIDFLLTLSHEYYHSKVFHEKTSIDHSLEFQKAMENLDLCLSRLKYENETKQKEMIEELALHINAANQVYYREEIEADNFAFSHLASFGIEVAADGSFKLRDHREIAHVYENSLFSLELKKIHKILSSQKSMKSLLVFVKHFPRV